MRIYYHRVMTFLRKQPLVVWLNNCFTSELSPPDLEVIKSTEHLIRLNEFIRSMIEKDVDVAKFAKVRIEAPQTHHSQLISDLMSITTAVTNGTDYQLLSSHNPLMEDWFTDDDSYVVTPKDAFTELARTLQILINACDQERDKSHVENVLLGYQEHLLTVQRVCTVCHRWVE